MYCSDVDTRPESGGFVWYRNTSLPSLVKRALTDVQLAYPSVLHIDFVIIVTWIHVGHFPQGTDKVLNTHADYLHKGVYSTVYLYR